MTAAAGTKRSCPQNSLSSEDPRSNDGKVAERWSLGAEREMEQQVPAFLAHYNFCGEKRSFSHSRRARSRVGASAAWLVSRRLLGGCSTTAAGVLCRLPVGASTRKATKARQCAFGLRNHTATISPNLFLVLGPLGDPACVCISRSPSSK